MTENYIIQFGLGEQTVLLRAFLKSGDTGKVSTEHGCSKSFVSQVLNQHKSCYSSKALECCLFKTARENALKSEKLTEAWIKLFGEESIPSDPGDEVPIIRGLQPDNEISVTNTTPCPGQRKSAAFVQKDVGIADTVKSA